MSKRRNPVTALYAPDLLTACRRGLQALEEWRRERQERMEGDGTGRQAEEHPMAAVLRAAISRAEDTAGETEEMLRVECAYLRAERDGLRAQLGYPTGQPSQALPSDGAVRPAPKVCCACAAPLQRITQTCPVCGQEQPPF